MSSDKRNCFMFILCYVLVKWFSHSHHIWALSGREGTRHIGEIETRSSQRLSRLDSGLAEVRAHASWLPVFSYTVSTPARESFHSSSGHIQLLSGSLRIPMQAGAYAVVWITNPRFLSAQGCSAACTRHVAEASVHAVRRLLNPGGLPEVTCRVAEASPPLFPLRILECR